MSARGVEHVLARLYADAGFRESFLAAPESALRPFNLTEAERFGLLQIDLTGLHFAAESYARKRAGRRPRKSGNFLSRLFAR